MSDAKTKITFQLITEFMNSVKAKTICPFCGGTSWTIEYAPVEGNPAEAEWIAAIPFGAIPGEGDKNFSALTSKGMAAIPFVCNSCGFMRPHSFRIFNQWLNGRAEAAGKESVKDEH